LFEYLFCSFIGNASDICKLLTPNGALKLYDYSTIEQKRASPGSIIGQLGIDDFIPKESSRSKSRNSPDSAMRANKDDFAAGAAAAIKEPCRPLTFFCMARENRESGALSLNMAVRSGACNPSDEEGGFVGLRLESRDA
jgi:hypothetical protein